MPILRRIFAAVLKSLGCKAPMAIDAPGREWKLSPSLKEQFHAYRLTCNDVTKKTFFGETLAAGLHKAPYWVSTVALFGTLMWPHACSCLGCSRFCFASTGGSQMRCVIAATLSVWSCCEQLRRSASLPVWSGHLSTDALKMATLCFQERFLYGLAVLEVDMRRQARLARLPPKRPVAEA